MRRTPSAGEIRDGKPDIRAHEHVHRLRPGRRDDRLDVVALARAGGVEHVGAGLGVGRQPADRVPERVRVADEEAFGAGGQEHVGAACIDRGPRCRDALDREGLIVERLVLVAARILDRQPGDAGRDAALHVGRDPFRLMGVARLEVGVHRQLGRGDDLGDVAERHVDGDGPVHVRQRLREGEARARRRQRLEAETAQIARRADVPRVRDHEAAALVELAEGGAPLVEIRHRTHPNTNCQARKPRTATIASAPRALA